MTPVPAHPLAPYVAKLERSGPLASADRDAILAMPHSVRTVAPGTTLLAEGRPTSACCFVVSGFACRQKLMGEGTRQILALHIRGDAVDVQNALLPWADHSVVALTRVEAAFVPNQDLCELFRRHPDAGLAMWRETLLDAAIQREWTVNLGRRDARARIAHLLCELAVREHVMETDGAVVALPLTQEQLADCTGLTSVHVNRVLQTLRRDGLIEHQRGSIRICTWDRLRAAAGFDPAYLYTAGNGR